MQFRISKGTMGKYPQSEQIQSGHEIELVH